MTSFDRLLDGFETRWGFPHCASVVDGTHIPIVAQTTDHCDYFNTMWWQCPIMQAVVDHRMARICPRRTCPSEFQVMSTGWRWILFSTKKRDIDGVETAPVIIGDAAYPLLNWLLKAFHETTNSTAEEKHFNYRLSRARMVVENAFCRLNGSFRILMKRNDWHWYNIDDGGRMRYPAQ